MKYAEQLTKSMDFLAKDPRSIFLGQAVAYPGTAMTNTLKNVSKDKLYELPVAEEMQMGMTTGLAMNNLVPISIFPRWNFLLLGINQLVNHLDKISVMSNDKFKAKAIIRTSIGSQRPLHPQHQHIGDFSKPIQDMCKNIEVIILNEPSQIFPAYEKSLNRQDGKSTILVEYGDYYQEK
jgi:pyruvate/2-oxoglutarate/acetoin dehydrogenase E1 component|tara:strand:+ start:181 stop:717 length:537 start_codon:yes stop_codon:yes gene_type:complete